MKKKFIISILAILILYSDINLISYASGSDSMIACYIINKDGYYTETVYLIKQDGVDYTNYIETEPDWKLKKPKWDGTKWVEGYIAPTPSPSPSLNDPNNYNDTTTSDDESPISLTATTLTLSDDTQYDININNKPINVKSYSWKSSNSKVATVNKSGVVTGKGNGSAKITCEITTSDNKSETLTAKVIIGSDIDNPISLSDNNIDLDVGDKYSLTVENSIKGANVKFTSSDNSVAKVKTTSGVVTGLSKGDCNILCTIKKGSTVYVLKCDCNVG